MVPFSKFTGCGNDFILIDNRDSVFTPFATLVSRLCHRHHGIGADGVIFLESSKRADYKMRIFNADGSEAEMCGNGLRCLVRFIEQCGDSRSSFSIETKERVLRTTLEEQVVTISMGELSGVRWDETLESEGTSFRYSFLNTGVPHVVVFVDALVNFDLKKWGPLLRAHPHFGEAGTNVNIARIIDAHRLEIRTYERGVEAETLACGTGATAAALAAHYLYKMNSPIDVIVKSGEKLKITFNNSTPFPQNICLTGPAFSIFDGHFRINSIK